VPTTFPRLRRSQPRPFGFQTGIQIVFRSPPAEPPETRPTEAEFFNRFQTSEHRNQQGALNGVQII